jgi:importin subunit alpha-2
MRRTEENDELRKLQKEDNLKRRNLEIDDEPLNPLETTNLLSIEDIVNGMFVAAFVFSIFYFLIFFYIT